MAEPLPGGLGPRLRALRKRAKLSQQALGSKAGLSWSIIAALEQGKSSNPRLDTLRSIARVLKVSLLDLLGEELLARVEEDENTPEES